MWRGAVLKPFLLIKELERFCVIRSRTRNKIQAGRGVAMTETRGWGGSDSIVE